MEVRINPDGVIVVSYDEVPSSPTYKAGDLPNGWNSPSAGVQPVQPEPKPEPKPVAPSGRKPRKPRRVKRDGKAVMANIRRLEAAGELEAAAREAEAAGWAHVAEPILAKLTATPKAPKAPKASKPVYDVVEPTEDTADPLPTVEGEVPVSTLVKRLRGSSLSRIRLAKNGDPESLERLVKDTRMSQKALKAQRDRARVNADAARVAYLDALIEGQQGVLRSMLKTLDEVVENA